MEFGIWASRSQACMQNHMTTIIFLYIAVCLFSLFFCSICMKQHSKKCTFYINSDFRAIATLNLDFCLVNCVGTPERKFCCASLSERSAGLVVTVVSPKHPRPQDASHADKHAWVARCSNRSQSGHSACRCLTHSNHSVVHGSPPSMPHNNNN